MFYWREFEFHCVHRRFNVLLKSSAMPKDLSSWLSYIESLHPKSIAMGLDRIKLMIERLQLQPEFPIISVAGTNGKGSTCAMLEQIYKQAGYQVGCYTSPHLLRYNERVRVNGIEVSDDALCAAFSAVESARTDLSGGTIQLTYFEVGTLAAMWHFMQTRLDIVILEVGLGGRLDAVNAFEPNCAIVTSVDLDHQEFLGDTREKIGFEKAGVYRAGIPAICGEVNPPASLVNYAHEIQTDFKCIHQDFDFVLDEDSWQYTVNGKVACLLPFPALQGAYQLNNAACAVTAVEALQPVLPVKYADISTAMQQVQLAGRFQIVNGSSSETRLPRIILDVAHNPHAARALAENLKVSKSLHKQTPQSKMSPGKTFAVFAMLADKDINGVVEALKDQIDAWYVAGIEHARGATAADLALIIRNVAPKASIKVFDTADSAYRQACIDMQACIDVNENDKIAVFGSFFTVSSVMQLLSGPQ
jgi:dihydrofolate synthase/folylpolyglutamate synthase